MTDGFEIKFDFAEKWVRFAKPEYLQIYIYILSRYKKDGEVLLADDIVSRLHIRRDTVDAALDFWITADVLGGTVDNYFFRDGTEVESSKKRASAKTSYRTKPSYTSAEIDAAVSENKDLDFLFKHAEKVLDRLLSPSDYEMIYSFVDWLGLPVEVVVMLMNFVATQGKTNKRYIETIAIDWADKGITTYESAEEYIKELEAKLSQEGKIRGILGIYDRALTQTEKKYIQLWCFEKNVPTVLIEEAYSRTVEATGKLSWAYMNKIITNWLAEGIRTLDAIKSHEALYKLKNASSKEPAKAKSTVKSKFNNYVDSGKPDYSNFAEQILNDMLDEE